MWNITLRCGCRYQLALRAIALDHPYLCPKHGLQMIVQTASALWEQAEAHNATARDRDRRARAARRRRATAEGRAAL